MGILDAPVNVGNLGGTSSTGRAVMAGTAAAARSAIGAASTTALSAAPSRLLARQVVPSGSAPTVTFATGLANSQIKTSTAILSAVADVIAGGNVTVVDGCNMQHPSGGFPYSATYRPYSIQQNINGQGWKSNYSIQFWTDAPKFEVAWVNRGPVTYRVWADDAAVGSLVPVVKTTTGNAESIVVDFTGVGGAIPRRIRVDLTWADFAGIVVPSSAYSIWPAKQRGPTVFMIGDSLTGGSGHSSSYGNQIPHVLGQLLGWDNVWNLGIGGTGYATKNAPSSFDNSALPQVQYLAPSSATPSLAAPGSSLPTPDIVIVSHGHNDAPTWTAAVTAAGNTLAQARAQWPTALIFVTSALGNSSATGEGSFLTSNEAALFAAVAPYVDATISAWTGPGRPWLTGTGNTSATTGSGNGDLYIGSDSVHWNDAGILYVGARLASEILGLLRG